MSNVRVSKNDGVSPVIGTILLVALTAILIGIVGAVLMGFASPEPAPILGISIVQQGNITTITHLNGAVLPAGKFKILVDGVDKTAAFGGTGDFGPGMKLSWDSGAEKVGTVSVVYTGETGASMLIIDKKIGKTGSGGSTDLSILSVGGEKFTLTLFNGTWNILKNNVSLSLSGYSIPSNEIYYQDGNYWVAYNPEWLSKENAADPSFTIEAFNSLHNPSVHPYDVFVKVDTSRVLTIDNTDLEWGIVRKFKSDVKPVKRGALYKNGTSLYVNMNSAGTGAIEGFGGFAYNNDNGWRITGILTT